MALEATIAGLGFTSFLFLYAAFNISSERMMEKAVLYFLGLIQTLVMVFVLLAESLEVGSQIDYLSVFLEKYFIFMIICFITIIILFMLNMIEKALKNMTDGNNEKE